jgi:hypothetical protein
MPITRPWNYGIPRTTEELHSNHAVQVAVAKDTVEDVRDTAKELRDSSVAAEAASAVEQTLSSAEETIFIDATQTNGTLWCPN